MLFLKIIKSINNILDAHIKHCKNSIIIIKIIKINQSNIIVYTINKIKNKNINKNHNKSNISLLNSHNHKALNKSIKKNNNLTNN